VVACDAHIEQERTDIDGYHHEAVNRHGVRIIQRIGNGAYRDTRNWEMTMKLTQFAVDDGSHNSDGLLLHGSDGDQQVTGFISRRVMDDWSIPDSPTESGKAFIASSTTRSVSPTSQRSSASLRPNMSEVRRSTASTRLWIFCCPTSLKAKRR
jgi:hypothetical protein